jgi:hypothetical protein
MRVTIRGLIVCVGVAWAGVALAEPVSAAPAAPKVDAQAQYEAAEAQLGGGNAEKAAELVEQGLKAAPRDRKLNALKGKLGKLLFEKGRGRFEQRDYLGALDAYEAYLKVATFANRRVVEKIIKDLAPARTTSLEITVANGPADLYIDSRTLGVVCKAAPACKKAWLPGPYDVFAERPGFEPWTGPVTIAKDQTTKLAITLVEKPSQLTVRVTPPEASVTVDGAAHDAARPIAAGKHKVVVSLAGYTEQRLEIEAREGKPVEREVVLKSLPATPAVASPVPPRPADSTTTGGGIFTGRRKIALAAGGASVVALGVGVVLGLQAGGLEDDAYDLCESPEIPCLDALEANDLNERARSRALAANVAFGVAGGAAIAAAVLWLTGAPESPAPRRVSVTPRLGGGAGLDVAVRF